MVPNWPVRKSSSEAPVSAPNFLRITDRSFGGTDMGEAYRRVVRRTYNPALRARTGGGLRLRPAWVVRAAVGQVGKVEVIRRTRLGSPNRIACAPASRHSGLDPQLSRLTNPPVGPWTSLLEAIQFGSTFTKTVRQWVTRGPILVYQRRKTERPPYPNQHRPTKTTERVILSRATEAIG